MEMYSRKIRKLNPFLPNVPFLTPLKTSENQRISDVFRGVKKGTLGRNRFRCHSQTCASINGNSISSYTWKLQLTYLLTILHFCNNAWNKINTNIWVETTRFWWVYALCLVSEMSCNEFIVLKILYMMNIFLTSKKLALEVPAAITVTSSAVKSKG